MTNFMRKSFSVGGAGSKEFDENYERTFSRKNDAADVAAHNATVKVEAERQRVVALNNIIALAIEAKLASARYLCFDAAESAKLAAACEAVATHAADLRDHKP